MNAFLKPDIDDKIRLQLTDIYSAYGYKRFKLSKFEPYEIYMRNKHFVDPQSIVTFSDNSGRLMALKPDVTLSIVSSVKETDTDKKVFYHESVFRKEKGGDIKEISQSGIEYIGGDTFYSEFETLFLAAKTLSLLNGDYIITVGNLDFIDSLPAISALEPKDKKAAFNYIKSKNRHSLASFLDGLNISKKDIDVLINVIDFSGEGKSAVSKLKDLVKNTVGEAAIESTDRLLKALSSAGINNIKADFSVINHMSYYNGTVFQGYLPEVNREVLSGGRYDNMMKRFGKEQKAIGFAFLPDSLYSGFKGEHKKEALIIYHDADISEIVKTQNALINDGYSVKTVTEDILDDRIEKRVVLK